MGRYDGSSLSDSCILPVNSGAPLQQVSFKMKSPACFYPTSTFDTQAGVVALFSSQSDVVSFDLGRWGRHLRPDWVKAATQSDSTIKYVPCGFDETINMGANCCCLFVFSVLSQHWPDMFFVV